MEHKKPKYLKFIDKPAPAQPKPWNYDSEDAYLADRWRHRQNTALWRYANYRKPKPTSPTSVEKEFLHPNIQKLIK